MESEERAAGIHEPTPSEYQAECVRIARRHDRRVRPRLQAIRVSRESGAIVGVIVASRKPVASRPREARPSRPSRRRVHASRGNSSGEDGEPPRDTADLSLRGPLDKETREALRRLISEAQQQRVDRARQRLDRACLREGCEAKLSGRSHRRYCSPACKQAGYRRRKAA